MCRAKARLRACAAAERSACDSLYTHASLAEELQHVCVAARQAVVILVHDEALLADVLLHLTVPQADTQTRLNLSLTLYTQHTTTTLGFMLHTTAQNAYKHA